MIVFRLQISMDGRKVCHGHTVFAGHAAQIKQACFRVRFAGAKSFRNVMVSGSRARYTQDHNGRHVTAWLIGTGIAAEGKIDESDLEDGDDSNGME